MSGQQKILNFFATAVKRPPTETADQVDTVFIRGFIKKGGIRKETLFKVAWSIVSSALS